MRADPGVAHAQWLEDPAAQMVGIGPPGFARDDDAGQHVASVRILHSMPGLLLHAVLEGKSTISSAAHTLSGDHRHRGFEVGKAAAVIEQDANRHLGGLRHLRETSV